ncbi:hypothetical protein HOD38_01625 [archaeon]|jgi:hypothetical protein|nr:hypothetical protein [archaeon]MBT4396944.1 hypothetical protein [archaeon]MBT4440935.1 hypothetical protein [archaeon]
MKAKLKNPQEVVDISQFSGTRNFESSFKKAWRLAKSRINPRSLANDSNEVHEVIVTAFNLEVMYNPKEYPEFNDERKTDPVALRQSQDPRVFAVYSSTFMCVITNLFSTDLFADMIPVSRRDSWKILRAQVEAIKTIGSRQGLDTGFLKDAIQRLISMRQEETVLDNEQVRELSAIANLF